MAQQFFQLHVFRNNGSGNVHAPHGLYLNPRDVFFGDIDDDGIAVKIRSAILCLDTDAIATGADARDGEGAVRCCRGARAGCIGLALVAHDLKLYPHPAQRQSILGIDHTSGNAASLCATLNFDIDVRDFGPRDYVYQTGAS